MHRQQTSVNPGRKAHEKKKARRFNVGKMRQKEPLRVHRL
ncbi:MAG TPA: hypothetical protein DEF41_07320 [Desulfovibrio sp.]|uniref:Uncharacterized protein n=1 Tax=Nitratidesulfovibrio vulgaris (strain ATCC 29579 / DSM 644 / CCUG 34227 / NCIMB 8303 / VKM B-1760 / Hildenborough) TaxID=882 RepID=Q728W4_NITV2|nr:hypothetical protein DVU_2488 [Nitratidesulfovibrio vulgaris str. Hildenborough]HBW15935.1 hypothetical protein [Desulfovibrio sp.]